MTASVSAPDGYRPGTAEYRRVVGALFAAGLATFALLYSTQSVLPAMAREFGVSSASSTLAVSLTTLGLGFALLIAGPLSDRFGRTVLIHWSLGASTVLGMLVALAPNWTSLLLLRLAAGIVLAGLPAVATAYMREELHPSSHARAAGIYIGGNAIGGMLGRLLTGAVADIADWRWGVFATALVGIGCAVAVVVLLPASRHFESRSLQRRALVERTRRAVTEPGLLALYAVAACASGAIVAVFNTVGFRLEDPPYQLSVGLASLVFLVYPVGSLSAIGFGRLADHLGRRAVLPIGSGIAIIGVVLTEATSLPLVILGLALLAAGFFGLHGVATGWVPARAHAGGLSAAQAASLYLVAYYLGSSIFGTLAGVAMGAFGWTGVVVLSCGLFAVTGIFSLWLRRAPSPNNSDSASSAGSTGSAGGQDQRARPEQSTVEQ